MPKEVTINSKNIYNDHNNSYFCSANIVSGRILSLCEERGREGGEIYCSGDRSTEYPVGHNGSLQECMEMLAREFGDLFYEAVYIAADVEPLDPINKVVIRRKQRDIKRAKEKIACAKVEYESALEELMRLE